MDSLFGRILLGRNRPIKAALALILACIIIPVMPVTAETPKLRFVGTDMAPSTIYLGEAHAEEMNDIVLLQINIDTTDSEGVNLTSITIHRTGLASDTDVEKVNLYMDSDYNGTLDPGIDALLSSASFELGNAEFSVLLTITPSNPLSLLVAVNISSEATSGETLGVDIPYGYHIDTEENADIEFQYPICSKNSTILLDTDGDLNPDITDPDDDNDGYTDEIEMICGSDTKDPDIVPKDTDHDYVPDSIDTDDDNDGEPDRYDDFPLDKNRQRDYTIVYIYGVVAAVFIIALILVGRKGKPKPLDKKALSEEEGEDEFDIGSEDKEEFGAEIEDEIDEELLGEQ